MSETPESAAGGAGASSGRPIDYSSGGTTYGQTGSGLLRLGGSLGIAACAVGLVILLGACAGFGKIVVMSLIPVALSIPGLAISIVGAVTQKSQITEDTHVMHAL